MTVRTLLLVATMTAASLADGAVRPTAAQEAPPHAPWAEVHAGSELERYLRTLQLLGPAGPERAADPYPWSLRGFSPLELERVAPPDTLRHPWRERFDLGRSSAAAAGVRIAAPRAAAIANTSFPYGSNDGAVWAGRGLTVAAAAGATYRRGPLSASVQPVAFWAQNADFGLQPAGGAGTDGLADPRSGGIDHPQRFGTDPYARLDAGESWARLDWPWLATGVSTAGMSWGPAERFPLVLGGNAPGFLHAFVGTGSPVDLRVAELHGRIVWGRLEESGWARDFELSGPRLASAAVAVVKPAWPAGLELGAARFFHLPWRDGGPTASDLLRPFEALTKARIEAGGDVGERDAESAENQLASAFFRWIWPDGGLEVYGELYREDHAWDFRDLLVEPDHDLASTLGLRKAWRRGDGDVYVFEAEVMDSRISHLERVRSQTVPYPHGQLRQGHTHRGQILGSPAAFGGEGLSVGVDRYHPGGRWSLRWERTLRRDASDSSPLEGDDARDVAHALSAEALVFRGPWEVLVEVTGVWNLNRDLRGDRGNARLAVGGRWRPW